MKRYLIAAVNDSATYRILTIDEKYKSSVSVVNTAELMRLVDLPDSVCGLKRLGDSLRYHDMPISDSIPTLKTDTSQSIKMTILWLEYDKYGEHKAILVDTKGKIKRAKISDLLDGGLNRVANAVAHDVTDNFEYRLAVSRGQYFKMLLHNNGDLIESYNLPKIPVDNLGSKCSRLFSDWISIDYFLRGIRSLGYKFEWNEADKSLNMLDNRVPVVNIPCGTERIDRLNYGYCNTDHIETIRIPSTVSRLGNEAFNGLPKLKDVVYQSRTEADDAFNEDRHMLASGLERFIQRAGKKDIADVLPTNLKYLSWFCSNIGQALTPGITDLSKMTELGGVSNCFSKVLTDTDIILPESMSAISASFINCKKPDDDYIDIKITKKVKSIDNGFSNNAYGSIRNIDFSEAESLLTIEDNSFGGILTDTLDLSKCVKLHAISASFRRLMNLTTLILPDNLENLSSSSFIDADNLQTVEIPGNLRWLDGNCFSGSKVKEVVIHGTNTIITNLKNYDAYLPNMVDIPFNFLTTKAERVHIRFSGNLRSIGGEAFSYVNISNIEFEGQIKTIGVRSFLGTTGEILDMFNWPVEEIPEKAFAQSCIKVVILPRTTTKIGEAAFFNHLDLSKIYIPSGVESLGPDWLTDAGRRVTVGATVYIVKGSYIAKNLKMKGINVREFDSDEEAYNSILGVDVQSSLKAMCKAQVVLRTSSNEVLNAISSPDYINNVEKLMKVYKNLTAEREDVSLELNQSKLKPLFTYDDLMKSFGKITSMVGGLLDHIDSMAVLKQYKTPSSSADMTNELKIFIDLLTTHTKSCGFIQTADDLVEVIGKTAIELLTKPDKIDSETPMWVTDVKYNLINTEDGLADTLERLDNQLPGVFRPYCADESGAVVKYYINVKSQFGRVEADLWLVIIGSNIVYVTITSRDEDVLLKDEMPITKSFGIRAAPMKEEETLNIENTLGVGDIISIGVADETEVFGVKPPASLWKLIIKGTKQLRVIGGTLEKGKGAPINHRKPVYLMSERTGDIYTCDSIPNKHCEKAQSSDEFEFLSIDAVDRYGSWSAKLDGILTKLITGTTQAELITEQWALMDSTINKLKASSGAYDEIETCFEWETGKTMTDLNIESVEELTTRSLTSILESMYFYRTTTGYDIKQSARSVQMKDGRFSETRFTDFRGTKRDTTLARIVGGQPEFVSYISDAKGGHPDVDNEYYLSALTPSMVLKHMRELCSSTTTPVVYIDNVSHNESDFKSLCSLTAGVASNGDFLKVGLSVCKANGAIFLTCGVNRSEEIFLLFRMKNMKVAMVVWGMIVNGKLSSKKGSWQLEIMVALLSQEIQYLISKYNNEEIGERRLNSIEKSAIHIIREAVLDGIPNGIVYTKDYPELYNAIAKQPKDH